MKIYTKKVPVTTYEEKVCGYEVSGFCRKAEYSVDSRTRAPSYETPYSRVFPPREPPEVVVDFYVDGQVVRAEILVNECPTVAELYSLFDVTKPCRLRLSIVREEGEKT